MRLLVRVRQIGIAVLGCAALSACGGGGGGGGGDGGGSNPQPTIVASVLSFPTGASPPGFLPTGFNTDVGLKVTAQDGSPITTAVVKVNGTTVNYSSAAAQYLGAINVTPGAEVAVSVNVGGVAYNASGETVQCIPDDLEPCTRQHMVQRIRQPRKLVRRNAGQQLALCPRRVRYERQSGLPR